MANAFGPLSAESCCEGVAELSQSARRARLLLLDDHRLDARDDAVGDLDLDHARAHGLDRLLEVDLAAIDADAAGLLDRLDDVLRGHRAEEAAVVARLLGDGEDGPVEQRRALLRALGRLGRGALGGLLAAA